MRKDAEPLISTPEIIAGGILLCIILTGGIALYNDVQGANRKIKQASPPHFILTNSKHIE